MKFFIYFSFIFFIFNLDAEIHRYDIIVYGGSSAGIIAAVQASRLGKSVALIHPNAHVGGATANGLGIADINKHYLIGGLTKEFFHRIWLHYEQDEAWIYETKKVLKNHRGIPKPQEKEMWVFEPHVAENVFLNMLKEAKVSLFCNEKLNLSQHVKTENQKIKSFQTLSGNIYEGNVFIDATYEGDLMAKSSISYTLGREKNDTYQETYNGIIPNFGLNYFHIHVNAYNQENQSNSGLLSRVHLNEGGFKGEADKGIQAYTFRLCLTDHVDNQIKIEKPADYDESQYEILFRAIRAKAKKFIKISSLPNCKCDCNNFGFLSIDYIGMNWDWPEADYETREKIALAHQKWQLGLIWTLQNHYKIPNNIRKKLSKWGLPKDEFIDNQHWPYEIYVREARRMISSVVITEQTVMGNEEVKDGIAFSSYALDCHNVKYYKNAQDEIALEGGFYMRLSHPFAISYQAIVPKKEECENLVVPVCLSASHVAFSSIRMEPTYMMLGQCAAIAASLSIDLETALQDIPYERLKNSLVREGMIVDNP